MRYILENEQLRIEIDSFGAELRSVYGKQTETEYMWQADPKYWGRTSPVLFPFVGSLKNKEFLYEGKCYPMGQHGFARDMEFDLLKNDETEIWFQLTETEKTMSVYPFRFCLKIGYVLEGNSVQVLWQVENPDTKKLYFSIGAHPAFNCPLPGDETKVGYCIGFGDAAVIHHHGNDTSFGLSLDEDIALPMTDHKTVITEGFFDRCTYMVEGRQTGEVSLETMLGRKYVTVSFDMPMFAIWSPEGKNAPFVCIEPWCGRCDAVDFEGTLQERAYTNVLAPGEVFQNGYTMRFS